MAASGKHFVDQHRYELIQRVKMVNPILDRLLEEDIITEEGYEKVRSVKSTPEKMRELYSFLNNPKAKDIFYKCLEEHEKLLLGDLRNAHPSHQTQPEGAAASSGVHSWSLYIYIYGWMAFLWFYLKCMLGLEKRGLLVITSGDAQSITFYQNKLQSNVEDSFTCLPDGSVQRTDKKEFEHFYTHVSIIHLDDAEISSEHEVIQLERKKAWQDLPQSEMVKKAEQEIQLSDIFKHPSGEDKLIRTVMSIGNAGVGKTFLVNKFVSDWAKKKHQYPHLTFVFQFRHLNLLRGGKFTLAQLIHKCIYATKCIPEEALNGIFTKLQNSGNPNYDKSLFKLLFVFDGLDESDERILPLTKPKTNHDCSDDLSKPIPLEELLVNLIEGKLLRCAHIWITTRPAAAKQIPSEFVDMLMEVKGFTDAKKEEYCRKRFSNEKLANRIISHMQKSKSLHIMCGIPVFCSMAATVLHDMLTRDETGQLPKTMTEMNCRFLIVQTKRKNMKYGEGRDTNQQQLMDTDREILLKLGRLAFEHLGKVSIIFYQKDLEECGLNVKEASVYSGVCTEIFKGESLGLQKNVYSFVHLSIQEFLAAVYLFHCFTQKNKKVLDAFLAEEEEEGGGGGGGRREEEMTLDDFLYRVMKKALGSENGYLDLFVRFLHGLSLKSNQSLLGGLLGQTENSQESIQRATNNLKEITSKDYSPERIINIFYSLMEMNDYSVFQEIQQYLKSGSKAELSESQCSVLAFMLQMSEEVLDELNLDTYNTNWRGRWRLVPAVRNSKKARLVGCILKETHFEVVASALSSNPSHLKQLDLSYNNLGQLNALELLVAGLKSPNCCLEILRLNHCWLTERCCEVLASTLRSNPFLHLKELHLLFNVLNDSALQHFSGLTLQVKHGGEHWTNPQLLRKYVCELTLDPNTAQTYLSLSEKNRKVTYVSDEDLKYPHHPDRFDYHQQVLCSERLTGHCYWEVVWSGVGSIAVTYRGINRQGRESLFGYNDKSWSLECRGDNNSYTVWHSKKGTVLPVSVSSNRVAVYVDWLAGTVSFYTVSSSTLRHLYTFQTTFTEPLYAGFMLDWTRPGSSVSLCVR